MEAKSATVRMVSYDEADAAEISGLDTVCESGSTLHGISHKASTRWSCYSKIDLEGQPIMKTPTTTEPANYVEILEEELRRAEQAAKAARKASKLHAKNLAEKARKLKVVTDALESIASDESADDGHRISAAVQLHDIVKGHR